MRLWSALLAVLALALLPVSGSAAGVAWENGQSVHGVFDLGGPRSDGSLLVGGSGQLYELSPTGQLSQFAPNFHDDAGAENYFAVSPGLTITRLGCAFAQDETYVLRVHGPIGITRISAAGDQATNFANVPGGLGLNGIAFDTVGAFGHRLLASGGVNGKNEIVAVDCAGRVQVVTSTAPTNEGGLAVAPMSFGVFGGDLIAPDELSGVIWAVGPDGTSHKVVDSGLPHGGDIGVEGVAFVPSGFSRGGFVYYADRLTPGNPHPGTDHVLRLASADLVAAGVQDGDLLAATEGGASMIAVHCGTSCSVITVVGTPTTAHGEGHLAFTINQVSSPSPTPSPTQVAVAKAAPKTPSPAPFIALLAAVVAGLAVVLIAITRRR